MADTKPPSPVPLCRFEELAKRENSLREAKQIEHSAREKPALPARRIKPG